MERRQSAPTRLEFQRQNLWVGLFVLIAFLAFIAVTIVSVQDRLFRREYRLNTSFSQIQGLQVGDDVVLRGFTVGRVDRIRFAMDPEIRFEVRFTVEESVKLPAGTRVRLNTRGISSEVLDLVTPGDPLVPDAPPAPDAGRPVLYLEAGATLPGDAGGTLDSVFSDAQELVRSLTSTVRSLDAMLNERIGPQVETTLATVDREMETLAPELRRTLAEARGLLSEADAALVENRPLASKLLVTADEEIKSAGELARHMDSTLGTLEEKLLPVVDSLSGWIDQVDALLAKTEGSISKEEAEQLFRNVLAISESGKLLIEELEKRPWRLVRRTRGEKKDLMQELKERKAEEEAASEAAGQDPPR